MKNILFPLRMGAVGCWIAIAAATPSSTAALIPEEPLKIGHEPQFVFDSHLVDNHWAIRYKHQAVQRVSHTAVKHPDNPVFKDGNPSYLWVIKDDEAGLLRMYYQANLRNDTPDDAKGRKYNTLVCYAESTDGVHWKRPHLDTFPGRRSEPNNVVIARTDVPTAESSAPQILEVPESDMQGYRHLMLYRVKGRGTGAISGLHVVGSKDGVHWDVENDDHIVHLHSDTANTIVFHPPSGRYHLYCRAKDIYRAWGEGMLDTGASRRVAAMTSDTLRTEWMEHGQPQTILVPDEIDGETRHHFFYGMPSRSHAGIVFGFLEPFRMNDYIHTELAVSRDGLNFERFPGYPKLIEYGEEGTWDDTMIFASPGWVEMGDEWWIYYAGWDGPHGTSERNGAIGLAKIRKEGFVSLRGPKGGGVVCTRRLIWPGGDLSINAIATGGELKVRVSDPKRKPIEGFDYDQCGAFKGDATAHIIHWEGRSLDELKDREIRLEFFLNEADLFTFRAAEK